MLGAALITGFVAGPASAATHQVKQGETLSQIASQSGTSWQALWRANPSISNPDLIFTGQKLTLPGGSTAKATKASGTQPVSAARSADAVEGGVWDRLAQCESGGNWRINTGNGFYGGLQFTPSSWRAVGGSGLPHQASKAEQIARAERLLDLQGWGAWPACSAKLGLR